MTTRDINPEPGIYNDIPFDEYLRWNCFSKSMIEATMRSAKHLNHYMNNPKKSNALTIGSLVDSMITDPEEVKNYVILPETVTVKDKGKNKEKPWNNSLKVCKEMIAELTKKGRIPIKHEQMQLAEDLARSINENQTAKKIIDESVCQISMVWRDKDTNILCKGRLDFYRDDAIADLKTTRDAEIGAFSRDMYNFGYHEQAAIYTDGWYELSGIQLPFQIIAAEKNPPFGTIVYNVGDATIKEGRLSYKKALMTYAHYLETDPELTKGYSTIEQDIEIPHWAFTDDNDFDEKLLEETE